MKSIPIHHATHVRLISHPYCIYLIDYLCCINMIKVDKTCEMYTCTGALYNGAYKLTPSLLETISILARVSPHITSTRFIATC